MIFSGPAAAGALVLLRCPHCQERQARARAPGDHTYECRKCARSFTVAEGTIDEAAAALEESGAKKGDDEDPEG